MHIKLIIWPHPIFVVVNLGSDCGILIVITAKEINYTWFKENVPGDGVFGINCDQYASASAGSCPPDSLPWLCPGPDAFIFLRQLYSLLCRANYTYINQISVLFSMKERQMGVPGGLQDVALYIKKKTQNIWTGSSAKIFFESWKKKDYLMSYWAFRFSRIKRYLIKI